MKRERKCPEIVELLSKTSVTVTDDYESLKREKESLVAKNRQLEAQLSEQKEENNSLKTENINLKEENSNLYFLFIEFSMKKFQEIE